MEKFLFLFYLLATWSERLHKKSGTEISAAIFMVTNLVDVVVRIIITEVQNSFRENTSVHFAALKGYHCNTNKNSRKKCQMQ